MDAEELKPCPLCGGRAELVEGPYDYDGGDRMYAFSADVVCGACDLTLHVSNPNPRKYVSGAVAWDFAVEAWNRRHVPTCTVVKVYEDGQYMEDLAELSCGHDAMQVRECYEKIRFCPTCGAMVVDGPKPPRIK